MAFDRGLVLLCTGTSDEEANDKGYPIAFQNAGFRCHILQALNFEYINEKELRSNLLTPECYGGLILTSPRAANAIWMSQNNDKYSIDAWKQLPSFCVGHATESIARDKVGLKNILGVESGNSKNLAAFIIKTVKKETKPLLQLCSDLARDTIQTTLSSEGLAMKKVVVYRTTAHKNLEYELVKVLQWQPRVIIFFSPSIVEYVKTVLHGNISIFEKIIVVAIGPVTQQALVDNGFKVDTVSEKPEPLLLRQAVEKAVIDAEIL